MDSTANKPNKGQDWQDAWNKNISQIDDVLIDLYKHASEKVGDLAEHASTKVQEMLDKTDMDEKARANWDKAKADGKLLGAQIENRVQHLMADGKITWAKLTKKDGAK